MKNQRLIFILLGIVLLVAIGFAIYFFFMRGNVEPVPGGSGNPFDGTGAGPASGTDTPPEVGVPMRGAGEEVGPRLWKITEGPVAYGAVAFRIEIPQEPIGTSTVPLPPLEDIEVRYADRASGNIYRFQLGERVLERLTNLTLPGIQEASWAQDGSRAFLRYLSDETGIERIETYSLPADGTSGYFLEPGLSDLLVTGANAILAVLPSTSGSVGTRSTLLGASPATVFSSPLSALRFFDAGDNYAAVTKPSALMPGYAFSVSQTSGAFTRLLGPLTGLSILPSPTGAQYIYSVRSNRVLQLNLFNPTTAETTLLPVTTLADKCVWANDSQAIYCAAPRVTSGTLPDDWYLGVVSMSDRVWKIDLVTRVASLEFDPQLIAEEEIDAVSLTIDAEDDVLVFTNKKDGSLWLYDL